MLEFMIDFYQINASLLWIKKIAIIIYKRKN